MLEFLRCPDCSTDLVHSADWAGAAWTCPCCAGRTLGIAQLRKLTGPEVANQVWGVAEVDVTSDRSCPSCARQMARVPPGGTNRPFAVEVCRGCHLVWLDGGEFEELRVGPTPDPFAAGDDPLRRANEIMAVAEAERIKRYSVGSYGDSAAPEHWWQWVFGFLGMPVKEDSSLVRLPVATLSVAALMVMLTLAAMADLERVVNDYGLIPAEPGRLGGATLITSFFLHGGIVHLVGNLYFLLVFGMQLEDRVGPWRLLAVLGTAAVVGDVFHLAWDPRPDIPVVGASGGIAGVVAFFGLTYPKEKFRILFFLLLPPIMRWIRISALALAGLFFLFDLLGAVGQLGGWSSVSSLAHLGGAFAGLVFFAVWRSQLREAQLNSPSPQRSGI